MLRLPEFRPRTLLAAVILLTWACEVPGTKPLEIEEVVAQSATKSAGDAQTARVLAPLPNAPSVTVADQRGRPMRGVTVTFTPSNGGSVASPSVVTGNNGVASPGIWTLGCGSGAQTLIAAPMGLSAVTFTATATAVTPGIITVVATTNNQTATVNTTVASAPSVTVGGLGGPAGCVTVNFSPTSGSGSVSGGTATTNAAGVATVGSWKLGTTAGNQTLTASIPGTSLSTTFSAAASAGPASIITASTSTTPTAQVNAQVTPPPAVQVQDQFGNNVSGNAVVWSIPSGGGAIGTPTTVSTNATGTSTATSWTLGPTTGTYTLRATAAGTGIAGNPVTFTATATPGNSLAIHAGGGQTAVQGTAVSTAPAVIVRTPAGAPVSGTAVTFTVATGGGNVTGGSVTTNSAGIATVGGWTLGPTPGTNTLTATATGTTPPSVSFTATAVAPTNTLAVDGGNNQTAVAGSAVAIAPTVLVLNSSGAPFANIQVIWTVGAGGGTINGTTLANSTTNSSGIATAPNWVLGATAGTNTLNVSTNGISTVPSSVTITATGTTGPATQIAKVASTDNQTASVGTEVSLDPAVVVRDANNNPVGGVTVTFSPNHGTVTNATPPTDATGSASVGSWTLGSTPGAQTLQASIPGAAVTFSATAVGTPSSVAANAPTSQSVLAGTSIPTATRPSVLVKDAANNTLAGIPVTFNITGGGGTISGGSTTLIVNTSVAGVATVSGWTLGVSPGTNTMTASVSGNGVSGNPVTFIATGTDICDEMTAFNSSSNFSSVSLSTSDCLQSGFYKDFYRITAGAQTGILITHSASAFVPQIDFTSLSTQFNGQAGSSTRWVFYFAPGTYDFAATSVAAGATGSYSLIGFQTGTTATPACPNMFTTRGVTLGSDRPANGWCSGYNLSSNVNSPPAGTRSADPYTMRLVAGQQVRIQLAASSFDPYLELRSGTTATGALVAADDDDGGGSTSLITFTPTTTGLYTVWVTTYGLSTPGFYTLTIDP